MLPKLKFLISACAVLPLLANADTIHRNNRETVKQFFNQSYLPGESVPSGWTGNVDASNAGTISSEYQNAILQ